MLFVAIEPIQIVVFKLKGGFIIGGTENIEPIQIVVFK